MPAPAPGVFRLAEYIHSAHNVHYVKNSMDTYQY